jgi:hypothetical protein
MLKSTRFVLGFGSISLAAIFAAATSHAATTTQYAGTNCVQAVTTSPSVWYMTGHAEAMSTSYFECPAQQVGGRLLAFTVYGYDVHPAQSVSCRAVAADSWGGSGYWTASVGSGTSFTGRFTLALGGVPAPGFVSPGFKMMTCTMNTSGMGGSYIGSYAVTEE